MLEQNGDEEERSTQDQVLELRRRTLSADQMQRFEGYIRDIFAAFGLDQQTPAVD